MLLVASVVFADDVPASPTNHDTTSTPKDKPVVGMTKEMARTYYGEPFTQEKLPNGERWHYRLKFNEVYGRALVPFYYDSPNVRWGWIDFGPDGRVRSYRWQRVILRS